MDPESLLPATVHVVFRQWVKIVKFYMGDG